MQSSRASPIIQTLKSQFARHGIPETLISVGGPKFAFVEFKNFVDTWEL